MPRNYINKQERELIGLTYSLILRCRDEFVKLNEKNMNPKEKQYIKTAITYYDKFMTELFARIGPKVGKTILNDFENATVYFDLNKKRPREDADINSTMDWCAAISAANCKGCTDDPRECGVYNMLQESGAPEFGDSPLCGYAYD